MPQLNRFIGIRVSNEIINTLLKHKKNISKETRIALEHRVQQLEGKITIYLLQDRELLEKNRTDPVNPPDRAHSDAMFALKLPAETIKQALKKDSAILD
jgi:hypothetical protein